MTEEKKKKNIIVSIFTSRFFWLIIIFLFIIGSIVKVASDKIEEARSTYDGLPEGESYPYSFVNAEGLYYDEYNFLSYEDDEYTSRRGIDVSEFQGEIDWNLVKESGVEFAMIRLGYRGYVSGAIVLDEYFEENVEGANSVGIDVGVYFFSQAVTVEEAIEEAQFVCANIKKKAISMPVAFDMEPMTYTADDRTHHLTIKEITELGDAFCTVIEKHGYDALIYGNPNWIFYKNNLALLRHRELWLANYTRTPQFPYEYVMWQYSDSGVIDGIDTPVDLNMQFIKKEQKNIE